MWVLFLHLALALTVAEGSSTQPPDMDSPLQDPSLIATSLVQIAGQLQELMKEARGMTKEAKGILKESKHMMQEARGIIYATKGIEDVRNNSQPRNCKDIYDSGDTGSGLRQVFPYDKEPHQGVTVYCNNTIERREGRFGWTVIQRRTNDTVRENFHRNWTEYENGFGDLEGEFWLGLKAIHAMTYRTPHVLRIDIGDQRGFHRDATYLYFSVGPPETNYHLHVSRFEFSHAGDSLKYHNGQQFTTYDADNDNNYQYNCAQKGYGGWWYDNCYEANLNGYPVEGGDRYGRGIVWTEFGGHGYSHKCASMMIRPRR